MQGEVVAIDAEERPEERPAQPILEQGPIEGDGTIRRRRLSSLNPSSSRFTLSIPLLGRAKVPLGEAMARGPAPVESIAKVLSSVQKDETAPEAKEASAPQDTASELTVTAKPAPLPETEQKEGLPIEGHAPRSDTASQSSWWGYWSGSTTVPPKSEAVSEPPNEESAQEAPKEEPIQEPSKEEPSTELSHALPPHHHAASEPALPVAATKANVPVKEDVKSVRSVQSQSSSAWYNPWTWYASAPAIPETEEHANGGTQLTDGKTESEMVKEEALARDDPPPPPAEPEPTPAQDPVQPTQPEENPVSTSMTTNASTWASFFSSNTNFLLTRSGKTISSGGEAGRIEGANANGEMEVMNIDEDEGAPEQPQPQQAQPPQTADVPKPAESSKPTEPAKPAKAQSIMSAKDKKPAPPMTVSESVKQRSRAPSAASTSGKPRSSSKDKTPTRLIPSKEARTPSPGSSKAPSTKEPLSPPPPNLVLPTWEDTFHTLPRNHVPRTMLPNNQPQTGKLAKTMKFVSNVLFDHPETPMPVNKVDEDYESFGKELPRSFDVLRQAGITPNAGTKKGKGKEKADVEGMEDVLRGCRKVVVIGIHGWFPGAVMRSVIGEPTGTSEKFVNMMIKALEQFQEDHGVKLEKITAIPLEGEGTINRRVEKLYSALLANSLWMADLRESDAVIFATHSQGSIVSTHIIDKLIKDGHILTAYPPVADTGVAAAPGVPLVITKAGGSLIKRKPQRVCCLALCGIHLGPLRYLSSSSLLQPYFQYFETTAARELFEFQNTENEVSKAYVEALRNVTNHGTKMVYVASLNDQVVPIYSGIFAAASHPLILRALYIDGDAYNSSDFLSNLLVLLLRILNTGLSDSGLLAHLSEATAGSLNGIGHSTAYEELAVYSLAVKYLFLTNDGLEDRHPELKVEPFNAATEQNDYEIPWALRDLIASPGVNYFFTKEIMHLRDAFKDWQPKTSILRDIKRKLQPITRLARREVSPDSRL